METKMCKPISEIHFDRLGDLVFEYREIETVLNACDSNMEIQAEPDFGTAETLIASDWLNDKLIELLKERLEIIENEINILGYTMENEPKEFKYHVNILKGGNEDVETIVL